MVLGLEPMNKDVDHLWMALGSSQSIFQVEIIAINLSAKEILKEVTEALKFIHSLIAKLR